MLIIIFRKWRKFNCHSVFTRNRTTTILLWCSRLCVLWIGQECTHQSITLSLLLKFLCYIYHVNYKYNIFVIVLLRKFYNYSIKGFFRFYHYISLGFYSWNIIFDKYYLMRFHLQIVVHFPYPKVFLLLGQNQFQNYF